MKRYRGIIPDDLVHRFPGWETADSRLTMWDYRASFCSIQQTLAAAHLLWPEIVEEDGMFFVGLFYNRHLVERLQQRFGHDKTRIERWVNARELVNFFGFPARDEKAIDDPELLMLFGQTLQALWSSRFAQLFPERHFVVELGEDFESTDGPAITAYEA